MYFGKKPTNMCEFFKIAEINWPASIGEGCWSGKLNLRLNAYEARVIQDTGDPIPRLWEGKMFLRGVKYFWRSFLIQSHSICR